jgi:hypothetical protein
VLKRAITGRYTEADLRVICEAWLRAKEYELLRHYADAALKHWSQRPVFVYFKAASYSDKLHRMPMQLQHQLERAGDASHAQNDRQTAQRIQRLFAEFDAAVDAVMGGPYLPPEKGGFNGGMDIDIGEPGAAFEMLLQMGGEDMLFKLARQAMGKAAFEALRKQLGGSDKEFARALVQVMTQEARASGMPMPPLMPPAPPHKPAPLKPAQDIQRDLFDD